MEAVHVYNPFCRIWITVELNIVYLLYANMIKKGFTILNSYSVKRNRFIFKTYLN